MLHSYRWFNLVFGLERSEAEKRQSGRNWSVGLRYCVCDSLYFDGSIGRRGRTAGYVKHEEMVLSVAAHSLWVSLPERSFLLLERSAVSDLR